MRQSTADSVSQIKFLPTIYVSNSFLARFKRFESYRVQKLHRRWQEEFLNEYFLYDNITSYEINKNSESDMKSVE